MCPDLFAKFLEKHFATVELWAPAAHVGEANLNFSATALTKLTFGSAIIFHGSSLPGVRCRSRSGGFTPGHARDGCGSASGQAPHRRGRRRPG
jgi:hypothetical protein